MTDNQRNAADRIAIGSDHRGVAIKARLSAILRFRGLVITDCGTMSVESCDYPDIAHDVAEKVACGEADRGILICGSGIGMSIAANKHPAIRAALCHDRHSAEMSRRHNDANVLCLSADRMESMPVPEQDTIIETWLTTGFEGGRHQRRVDKIPVPAGRGCNG
jgi:ribose 5-phosphate isomerase B